MDRFHHITVFLISDQEKASLLEAGIEFTDVVRGARGESVNLDIGEDDPRWQRVVALLDSFKGREGMAKKFRVQDLSMDTPTWKENLRQMQERVAAYVKSRPGPKLLNEYSGQSTEELLSLEGQYRIDSLVLAFEQAIIQKVERKGMQCLTAEERIVLAVEALEREVNNGGYDQFFVNSSREFALTIVGALDRIGCKKTATITQRAIEALGTSDLSSDAIEAAICSRDEMRSAKLRRCDNSYYKSTEPIAERLFEFIKANKTNVNL